jgi:hypothetical protein
MVSWCHLVEFTGTRPILPDEIEHLTTSFAKHSGLLMSFGTRGTTPTGLGEKERGGLPWVGPHGLKTQGRRSITEVVNKR